MYIVSALIIALAILNYVLSNVLYKEPEDKEYLDNVRQVSVTSERYLLPEPRYALISSIITGLMIGMYFALATHYQVLRWLKWVVVLLIFGCYLVEMSRKVVLDEEKLVSSKLFAFKQVIPIRKIQGMYVYSFNKKWLKQHALTTKLVVVEQGQKPHKIIISSFSNKKVFAMMKDCFGVTHHKMFIAHNEERKEP